MGPTNFNLQQSVSDYINLIRNQGSLTGSDAAELTAHLYDATDELTACGLSQEEAFIIACKRLGNEELLTLEYSKVNPSVNTNKIWAYLWIGFNMLYALPSLLCMGINLIYLGTYNRFQDSYISTMIVTSFHLVVIGLTGYLLRKKNTLSQFIEKQVQVNSLRMVGLSFLPLVLLMTVNPMFMRLKLYAALVYPVRVFHSSLAEFSYYMAIMSILLGALSLVFSVNKAGKLTLKMLFEKPSFAFLILSGIATEFIAAATRSIRIENTWGRALVFGLIYLGASYLIALYNKPNSAPKYLLIFSLFGLAAETIVGIAADMDRGNTYFTAYFVTSMVVCIIAGRFLGLKAADSRTVPENGIAA